MYVVEVMASSNPKRTPRKRGSTAAVRAIKASAGEPITYNQASIIGRSVGGMKKLSPKDAKKRVSYQAVLAKKGLTRGEANKIINALNKAKVVRWHLGIPWTAAKAKKAMSILKKHL
jgi:hypothetical protein